MQNRERQPWRTLSKLDAAFVKLYLDRLFSQKTLQTTGNRRDVVATVEGAPRLGKKTLRRDVNLENGSFYAAQPASPPSQRNPSTNTVTKAAQPTNPTTHQGFAAQLDLTVGF